MIFLESLQTHEQLPVVFEATDDNSISNLTRADINCDQTGTCYDGNFVLYSLSLSVLKNFYDLTKLIIQFNDDTISVV